MSEIEKRELKNYPYKSFDLPDVFTGEIVSYKAVPIRFYLNKNEGVLEVKVFKSENDFNNREKSSPNLDRDLPINTSVINGYAKLFQMIEASALAFLELSDDFALEMLEIDLDILQVSVLARHKSKPNRKSDDKTANWQEFEDLKQKFPAIVTAFVDFAFKYMATNDQLSKFK